VSSYAVAFVVGGLMCVLAQLVLDLTRLTAAHVMVLFVVLGAVAGGLGLYQPLVEFAGAGALVPLPSFGNAVFQGIMEDVDTRGFIAVFTGGLTAAAWGITSAILFGWLVAALFNPKG